MPSSGMWRVARVRTNVSEEHSASIIRVTSIGELGTKLAVTSNSTLSFMTSIWCVLNATTQTVSHELAISNRPKWIPKFGSSVTYRKAQCSDCAGRNFTKTAVPLVAGNQAQDGADVQLGELSGGQRTRPTVFPTLHHSPTSISLHVRQVSLHNPLSAPYICLCSLIKVIGWK
jgi:hypothetical protein